MSLKDNLTKSPSMNGIIKPTTEPLQSPRDLANDFDYCSAIAEHIKTALALEMHPEIAIICGSGLGSLADEVVNPKSVAYIDVPGFPVGNVQGHKGNLLFGTLENRKVMCLQGRVHPYEGRSLAECALPVRIAKLLGCKLLIMTSAVGGINKALKKGDLMLLNDHIFMPGLALNGPLVGPNDERFGPRFMSTVDMYDKALRKVAMRVAETQHTQLRDGIYAMVGGPHFESPAEIRWLDDIGADVVGMSVCHETIVARHCAMKVIAIALVTNICEHNSNADNQTNLHEEVLMEGDSATKRTARLIRGILNELDAHLA